LRAFFEYTRVSVRKGTVVGLIAKFKLTSVLVPMLVLTLALPAAAEAVTHKKKHVAATPATQTARTRHVARARKTGRTVVVLRNGHHVKQVVALMNVEPAKPSFGQIYGLHKTADTLELKSSVALVVDADTNEVLFSKNPQAVLPIASLTKLMTAVVVNDAQLPMAEQITITDDDIDTEKNSRSRLRVGTTLSREELLHLALMSSENRAAHALGRTYPGGLETFVAAMNHKAQMLGMRDTHYVEPTGLSSNNQSSAHDLATLVQAAEAYPVIREFSTSPEYQVEVGNRLTAFHTTNRLVSNPAWDIILQKTGFINEAGQCLVMQAKMAGRKLTMIFLDSTGKYSRIGDAERVRRWVSELPLPLPLPATTTTTVKETSTS
jgi:D-alanyl-D-alanine endopeptidase (penicillin-binding protein 7)